MEIGENESKNNITGYGMGREGKDVAKYKRITCKGHSHAKEENDERYSQNRGRLKNEQG